LVTKLSEGKARKLLAEDQRIFSQCASLETPNDRVDNFEQFASALNEVAEIAVLIQSSQAEQIQTINAAFQADSFGRQAQSGEQTKPLDYDFATSSTALRAALGVLETEIPTLERQFLPGSLVRNILFFVIVFAAWFTVNNYLVK
jgi:hypothetical protein